MPVAVGRRAPAAPTPLFRPDAVQAQRSVPESHGAPLVLISGWHRAGLALALVVLFLCAAAMAVVPFRSYARGIALVQASAKNVITTTQARLIGSVRAIPGARVKAGEVLIDLDAQADRDRRRLVRRSVDDAITTLLRDPADRAQQQRVTELHQELARIESLLADLVIRAPAAGTVADVWIRNGQLVSPGMPLLSLVGDGAPLQVTALLPARYRPMLKAGQDLTVELDGFPQARQRLRVHQVSQQAVGPAQVTRLLGSEAADSVPVSGPSILLVGLLETADFAFLGARYRFHDGMTGTAEVEVARQPLWAILLPFLAGKSR